jgi:hypothetical protein
MCFDRNINGNRDDNFFDWDYWSLHCTMEEKYFNNNNKLKEK